MCCSVYAAVFAGNVFTGIMNVCNQWLVMGLLFFFLLVLFVLVCRFCPHLLIRKRTLDYIFAQQDILKLLSL